MNFDAFRVRAEEIFEEIPAQYREGVDGLDVEQKPAFHPKLPDVYTMGECLSEFYPSEFGGAGEVRSRVVLYYGSFLALSRTHEDWDWEEELFETVTHEVRHHLEHLASEDALEEMDFAEDQNFARREGQPFDPFFFEAGNRIERDVFEVDGDVFIRRDLASGIRHGTVVTGAVGSHSYRVRVPTDLADVHFLMVRDVDLPTGGDLYIVLVRNRGLGGWVRGLLGGVKVRVAEGTG